MIGLGIRSRIRDTKDRWERRRIYSRVKDYTMVKKSAFCENLALAREVAGIRGCVVECGVWRGGISAGLCATLGPDRRYFLFDSFEGLPPAQPIDGPARWSTRKIERRRITTTTALRHATSRNVRWSWWVLNDLS